MFAEDASAPGVQANKLHYYMTSFDTGVKWRSFSPGTSASSGGDWRGERRGDPRQSFRALDGLKRARTSQESLIAVFVEFENLALGVRDQKNRGFDVELVLERLLERGGCDRASDTVPAQRAQSFVYRATHRTIRLRPFIPSPA